MPEELIERGPSETAIWPCNWPALLAWLDCATTWRIVIAPGGLIWLGLDYVAVDVVLRRRGDEGDETFALLRAMEQAALPILNERLDA